jgi:hypothetical protein
VFVRGRQIALAPRRKPATRAWSSGWLETAVAVVISVAGFGSAWSSYQAALWNSRQAVQFGLADAHRTDASQAALEAGMKRVADVGMFTAWIGAKTGGDERKAALYEKRFTPELRRAFAYWMAQQPMQNPQAAPSPFALGSYAQPQLLEAAKTERQAEREFETGMQANALSNSYARSAVVLALAMFLSGVGTAFRNATVRVALALAAIVACSVGLERIFNLPILPLQ